MRRLSLFVLLIVFSSLLKAQQTPTIGLSDSRPGYYAFTNAQIYVDYQTVIQNGALVIKEGRIIDVGKNIKIPVEAKIIDLSGKIIYPSFIDMFTHYGLPEVDKTSNRGPKPDQFYSSEKTAGNWNEAIRSTYHAVEEFSVDKKTSEQLRKLGFGTVATLNPDGIARGTSALVSLTDEEENRAVIKSKVASHYSFDKGSSEQNYPNSLMGSIALLRQTHHDAQWYNRLDKKKFTDLSLEAWAALQQYPQIFEVNDRLSLIRADKLGDEFGIQYIIKGNGDEYQRIEDIKNTNAPLIMPLNFPEPISFNNTYEEQSVSLNELKHWEMAPSVFAELEKNQIPFAITTHGLKKTSDFIKNLQKAIEYGLSEKAALKALTETPAQLLRVENMVGSLKAGNQASFIITSGSIFESDTRIYENWIQGKKYVINDLDKKNFNGIYQLTLDENNWKLQLSGKPEKTEFKIIINDSTEIKSEGSIDNKVIAISFKPDKDKEEKIRLSGWVEDKNFKGTGILTNGKKVNWTASYLSEGEEEEKKKEEEKNPQIGEKIYPFMAYGLPEEPQQEKYLIKNATVWTNEEAGIVENYDVLVENGKIQKVAKDIAEKGAVIIDATGKHLTSGIIDEHSHIATTGGANEFSHAITSEVRIADVLDPEDINIYRQLAGGVTAAQILHGSANPVGGQSVIVKHRWGVSANELMLNDGAQFLKHALGENVKQSRLPEMLANRFPYSRMGVEAIIRDAYQQALDYKKEWETYEKLSVKEKAKVTVPRIDLRMEALIDVLEEESFITCHTYVQSETNMILKLAEDFGIKAHTLIHNTEGYKLADKIAAHGAYASNLPDWWAYKFEVYQAIPYNTAMQVEQGVTVAIHSDNAELARRLNQEAAKTIKYGGLSHEEAWKLVTLNPAKILHLDHRMGSIKQGKDADLVIWSDNPLSMYAVAEKTMVDGMVYYDKEKDEELRQWIKTERNRIINKMLNQK